MNIVCKDAWQKITVDQWDVDPNDMKMTVKCLPTFKYDLPSENFPKVSQHSACQPFQCRSYCPAPGKLWNDTVMRNLTEFLPLQVIMLVLVIVVTLLIMLILFIVFKCFIFIVSLSSA